MGALHLSLLCSRLTATMQQSALSLVVASLFEKSRCGHHFVAHRRKIDSLLPVQIWKVFALHDYFYTFPLCGSHGNTTSRACCWDLQAKRPDLENRSPVGVQRSLPWRRKSLSLSQSSDERHVHVGGSSHHQ